MSTTTTTITANSTTTTVNSTTTTVNSTTNPVSVRFTRYDYLSQQCSHADYYGQFDSPAVRRAILRVIPMSDLMASRDPHMNDIKLSRWGNIRLDGAALRKLTIANGHAGVSHYVYSQSDIVCLAKEVAKRMINEQLLSA